MMNKNNTPFFFALAIVFGVFVGASLNVGTNTIGLTTSANEEKIQKLLRFIERDYVDAIDTDKILDQVVTDLIANLDPHSIYFPKDIYAASKENLQGNFEGIGVQFFMHKDSLVVTHVLKDGPSEKAGILAGDRILIADSDTLYNKNLRSTAIVKKLKGPANTLVNLKIFRKGSADLLPITIRRNKVAIQSAEVAYMLNDSLGYIKLDRFAATSYDEVSEKIALLKGEGAQNLVMDLRQNGGGYIHIANAIIDEFLEEGKLIVYTKNKQGNKEEFYATDEGAFTSGKVYVLIDENSASASEIFAGALQDNDKGTIIGRRSFGKGLVQQEMNLGDGSAVRLTVARYYTPTGRSIQKPYHLNGAEAYADDYNQRLLNGELFSRDSIKVNDSLKYTTPKGKIVYGGGGIIPDVFVPVDTLNYLDDSYFSKLNSFSFNYVDSRRLEFTNTNYNDFKIDSLQHKKILSQYITELGIPNNLKPKQKDLLLLYLKAFIVRQAFGEIAFYQEYNSKDNMLAKVLELDKEY